MSRTTAGFVWSFAILSISAFAFTVFRCYHIPLAHDEVATFYYYIQPGSFMPFYAHPDANNHVLNSVLAYFSYRFFGAETWALRLPQCLAIIVYFMVLWQWSKTLHSNASKFLLLALLILPAGLLSLFSLCRGYALSVACFLGIVLYIHKSVLNFSIRNVIITCIWMQLCLASNLSMLYVIAVLSVLLLGGLYFFKVPLRFYIIWLVQMLCILYWYLYAQFLNTKGALYYGAGISFWKTTIVSLMQFIWAQPTITWALVCMATLMGLLVFLGIQKKYRLYKKYSFLSLWISIFIAILLCIFFTKVFLAINFPEDRTGLYLYLIFAVIFIYALECNTKAWISNVVVIFAVIMVLPSWRYMHIYNHPWKLYETFPLRFYNTILNESRKDSLLPVIGGHRVRELIWGFQNYQSGGLLPHMYAPEQFQFLCDWAIAYPQDSVYAAPYYAITDRDCHSGFYLYKRRYPLNRNLLFKSPQQAIPLINQEYYTLIDTQLSKPLQGPLLAEWEFKCSATPVPFDAWVVLEYKGVDKQQLYYTRVPLALIRHNFNINPEWHSHITAPHINGVHQLVLYIWNKSKANAKLYSNSIKLYHLTGHGVDSCSRASL
jgi:hypothetical protein